MNIEVSFSISDVLDVADRALAAVSRRLPAFVAREDLMSVGKLAVLETLNRASGSLEEVRALCYVRARGAMLDEIRRLDVRPRRQRELMRAVAKATAAFESEFGRVPSDMEIADTLDVSAAAVRRAAAWSKADHDQESFSWDNIQDESAVAPSATVEQSELHAAVLSMLDTLTSGQANAVRLFYLDDFTLEQTASRMNVSTERARQLRDRGVEKLRAHFAAAETWKQIILSKAAR